MRPGASVAFVGRRVAEVLVEVLDPAGVPPERAEVSARKGSTSRSHRWSPAHPKMSLEPGRWEFVATAEGEALQSPAETVALGPDAEAAAVTLRLRTRPGIAGRIVFLPDAMATQAPVYALRFAGTVPDAARLVRDGQQRHVSPGDPEFAFRDLAPGTYLVGVGRMQGEEALSMEAVEVGDRMERIELAFPPVKPEDAVLVNLLGPAGEPVEGRTSASRPCRRAG